MKKIIALILTGAILAGVAGAAFGVKYEKAAGRQIILTAHRGYSAVAPENTLPAIEEAGKAGFYAAEFDIMPTADGVWVVFHDSELDRMTNGTGRLDEYTFEELGEITVDSGNGIEKYPDLKIPSLSQALEVCRKYSMRPTIEIKGGEAENMAALVEQVAAAGMLEQSMIIDFNSERLAAVRESSPEIKLSLLMNTITQEDIDFAVEHNTGIGFNFGVPKNYTMLGQAKEKGIELSSWTVDLYSVMYLLFLAGVDHITTNKITA